MVDAVLTRRALFASLTGAALLPRMAFAEDYIDLEWSDLIPEGEIAVPPSVRSLFAHDECPVLLCPSIIREQGSRPLFWFPLLGPAFTSRRRHQINWYLLRPLFPTKALACSRR